jgi:hypothetical protein
VNIVEGEDDLGDLKYLPFTDDMAPSLSTPHAALERQPFCHGIGWKNHRFVFGFSMMCFRHIFAF